MGKFEVIVSDISTPIRVVADTPDEAAERVEVATGHTALVVSVVGRGRNSIHCSSYTCSCYKYLIDICRSTFSTT